MAELRVLMGRDGVSAGVLSGAPRGSSTNRGHPAPLYPPRLPETEGVEEILKWLWLLLGLMPLLYNLTAAFGRRVPPG